MRELIGGASGLGWVAIKAVLLFAVAVIGLRLGERRTLAQLSAFDFAVAVAIGAIIGRGATAADTSLAASAVALVTLLVAHRVVTILRCHSRVVRLIDHKPRVLVARGQFQEQEMARAGLTTADVNALLRENGAGDLGQVGYLLYEPRGAVTLIDADREPGPLMRDGLDASGFCRARPGQGGHELPDRYGHAALRRLTRRAGRVLDSVAAVVPRGSMSYARQMLGSYLGDSKLDADEELLARVIDAATDCAQACGADNDADLSEPHLADMVTCIRLCQHCVDICAATAAVLSRPASWDSRVVRPLVEACLAICQSCGDECERHAPRHAHCRVCAEACRGCERLCADLLNVMK